MTNYSKEILEALRAKAECENNGWLGVYLDNVKRPDGMSKHTFAGHLGALEKAGLYRPVDGFAFGEVKTEQGA